MILPLGDSPNPRGVPVFTYALIAANIAIYLFVTLPLGATRANPADPAAIEYVRTIAPRLPDTPPAAILDQLTAYDLFVFRNGFRPSAPHLGALFASLFLHANFLHLFGNMLFLWIYGDNVEHRLRGWYPLAYLGTGVAATLFHTLFDPDSPLPLIGASGAISGVLGFYFLWFPHNRVRLLVLMVPFFMDVFLVSARVVLGMYLLVDNLLPFLVTRGIEGGGVAYGAHIGGFVAGLTAAWGIDRGELLRRPAEYRRPAPRVPEPADVLQQLMDGGRFAEAAQAYFALDARAARGVLGPAELLALADWLARNGHAQAALVAYRRHLRDYPNGPGTAHAHLGAGLVLVEGLGEPTPAYQHFLDALDADPSPDVAARARAGLAAIEARQKFNIGHPYRRGSR